MPVNECEELLRDLTRPEAYPDRPTRVDRIETHISWVFLTDRLVYKIKKPVRFSFLDYSTLEQRLHACRDELLLNSRLAPHVYRAVVPITRGDDGHMRIGGEGGPIEHAVEMLRLPAEAMLDERIRRGAASRSDIERLLPVLVGFYARAARGPAIDRYATAEAIGENVRDVLSTLESPARLPRAMFRRIRASQLQFVRLSARDFERRLGEARACEGHGDLRPEHVCLLDPPVVFDCVEFSLALRAADAASDLAFLAMECDFAAVPELSHALVAGYRARSGDDVPDRLFEFYKSYRACIRAKVNLLRADQQSDEQAVVSTRRARRYLELASFYAGAFYKPRLLVMVGTAGTGKSTAAHALAPLLGLELLRSDAVRQELAGHREPAAGTRQGIYSPAATRRTYDEMFRHAAELLAQGGSVVLDATFRDAAQRRSAERVARNHGAELHFIVCRCDREVAMARIAERLRRGRDISDARPELFDDQAQELGALADLAGARRIELDTARPVSELVAQVLGQLAHP